MKSKLLPFCLAILAVLTFSTLPTRSQTVINFDDLPNSTTGTFIADGYQGFNWTNFGVVNAILLSNSVGYSVGYGYGMVSASNVAFNSGGTPAEIDSFGTNFNFLSTYLTGAWNSNLNIEVEGFNGTNLVYDETKVVSATNATLFTFDYLDVDRLYFNSYGGQPAFDGIDETQFAMDNFTFEFIPEPSSFLLAALGGVTLVAFLRRKRVA
jgi:hypothetical protein